MQIFRQRIKAIAQSKAIAKDSNRLPKIGYQYLTSEQRASLILALAHENEKVNKIISEIITDALLDAYHDEVGDEEAEEDRRELARMIEDDNAQRARDMQQEARGY